MTGRARCGRPGRLSSRGMRVLAWVYLGTFVFIIAAPLIAGHPPTWWTVLDALFAAPIANDLIRRYRMKSFFNDEIKSITMTKVAGR